MILGSELLTNEAKVSRVHMIVISSGNLRDIYSLKLRPEYPNLL